MCSSLAPPTACIAHCLVAQRGYDEPLYLVSNMACVGSVRIEIGAVFGSKPSSRIAEKSKICRRVISRPRAAQRLLLATCLAYIWIIYLGVRHGLTPKTLRQIHRADRFADLSLFQLGLRYLNHLICQGARLPFQSRLTTLIKCVR